MHILKIARALRFQASLPLRFWGDCVVTTTYLINRIPSLVLQNKTPYEKLLHKIPNYSNLKVFGCFAVATNPSRVVYKFAPRGVLMCFSRISCSSKSSKNFFQPMLVSMPTHTQPAVYDDYDPILVPNNKVDQEEIVVLNTPRDSRQDLPTSSTTVLRVLSIPTLENSYWLGLASTLITKQDPKGFEEVVKDARWCDAMNAELPHDKKAIGSHWIFKTKLKSDGSVDRKKARLVVQGNRQMKGKDYKETFAPVVKMVNVRSLLAIAAMQGPLLEFHSTLMMGIRLCLNFLTSRSKISTGSSTKWSLSSMCISSNGTANGSSN
ncbi:retrovirus-related pol polyprotein from transposon TNT 1-94 [Tanacetum coccineum]